MRRFLRLNKCLLLSAIQIFHGNFFSVFNTFSTVGDRWKQLYYVKLLVWTANARSQPCLKALFFTLNYELKAGVHSNNTFNYQNRN